MYLSHIPPARNSLSELISVVYEKLVAETGFTVGKNLGYTAGAEAASDLLRVRGAKPTHFDAHSRGTLVQAAAFSILANTPTEYGKPYVNPNLFIRGVGGATSAEGYTAKGLALLGDPQKAKQISFTYFDNDPVSTSVLSGGNPGSWKISDLLQVWRTSNSMHSCYGSGASGCVQVEAPIPGGPQGTRAGNAKLVRFVGGMRSERTGRLEGADE
jgi:filamentous hemagglutinin